MELRRGRSVVRFCVTLGGYLLLWQLAAWPTLYRFVERSDLIVIGHISGVSCRQGVLPAGFPKVDAKNTAEVRGVIAVSRTLKGDLGKERHLRYRWICGSCAVSKCGELGNWMNDLTDGIWYLRRRPGGEVTSPEIMGDPGFRDMSYLAETYDMMKAVK